MKDRPKTRRAPAPPKLHPVTHDPARYRNSYCGPAAFSIITGLTAEEGAARIRLLTGARSVRGVSTFALVHVLRDAGMELRKVDAWAHKGWRERPTTAAWLRARRGDELRGMHLLVQTGHFIVVRGRKAADNFTTEPASIMKITGRRSRLMVAYRVTRGRR